MLWGGGVATRGIDRVVALPRVVVATIAVGKDTHPPTKAGDDATDGARTSILVLAYLDGAADKKGEGWHSYDIRTRRRDAKADKSTDKLRESDNDKAGGKGD